MTRHASSRAVSQGRERDARLEAEMARCQHPVFKRPATDRNRPR